MSTPAAPTERDVLGLAELLADQSDDPAVIAVLTDEELLALGGERALELTGSPFLDVAGFELQQAAQVALRSLIARGLAVIDPSQMEDEGEGVDGSADPQRGIQIDRRLAGIMTARSVPRAVVTLTRRVETQTTSLFEYVAPVDGFLEELIGVDGMHHFSVPTRDAVADRMRHYVDQNEVAGETDGEPVETTLAELDGEGELAERLRDTRALTIITSVEADAAGQISIMATSDAVFVMETDENESGSAMVREISRDTLLELLAELVPVVS